jgi:hypothetical protein
MKLHCTKLVDDLAMPHAFQASMIGDWSLPLAVFAEGDISEYKYDPARIKISFRRP